MKKVLVLDDDPSDREIIRMTLEPLGYEVDCYARPIEAISAFETLRYDLVLVDERMPGNDGLETIKEMRNVVMSRYIPIIVISGCDRETIESMAKRRGVKIDGHIYKDEFIDSLRAAFAGSARNGV